MADDQLQEKYQAFIKNSSEGIWLCEVDEPIPISLPAAKQVKMMFRVCYMAETNDAMARMYGLKSSADLTGSRLCDLLIEDDPQNIDYLTAFVESGYRLSGVESHERDSQGKVRIFRNSLVGIIKDGMLLRAWGTQHDITEQYLTNQALQKSEERLALAMTVSGVGMWEWHIASGELIWSEQLKQLFGLHPDETVSIDLYKSLIHPDDCKRIDKIVHQAIKSGKEYQIEHRIRWRDGTEHWILGKGKALKVNGEAVRMIGTSVSLDDTKRKDELENLNRKLKEQQAQLVELNHLKDEFIALASHQLRTPATAVKQYANMLSDGYFGELTPPQREALDITLASNERQLAIINDLLRVARLDAGKVVLKKQPTDIGALVRNSLQEQAEKFKSKQQTITIKLSRPKLQACADPERLRMAVENIIDNAHKYTPAGKSIAISISQAGGNTSLQIADQGVGIRKSDLPRLFQKFSRLENPLSEAAGGTGLGLYWASKVIALHGGSISVESKPRHGTTFTITIPNS